ncbi:MAG: SGNH/GDSL hydrolase family protein [Syntrophales bacterium]|nr:SGNH/GDSL hydrolase family protein [Syntrophales bacterium]
MKRYYKVVLFNLILIVIIVALFEGMLYILVKSPKLLAKCPQKIGNMIGYLYARERNTIQYVPTCARHDDDLGYTLKPGTCTFSGREFVNEYRINSIGVRDEEKALNHPEIIIAGDSFAMGWGVGQEETYAKRLEQKSGKTVLNAAISSYGTVREMKILKRVPTDNLRFLIIQYCGNDLEENREFYNQGNKLKTMSPTDYKHNVDLNRKAQDYYPGKYLWMKLKKRIDEFSQSQKQEKQIGKDEIDLFINAIMNSGLDLKHTRIVAFVMNGRNPDDNRSFPALLKKKIADGPYPSYIKNMIVLDFSDTLKTEHYYVLDDHLNKKGHELIADALLKVIKE